MKNDAVKISIESGEGTLVSNQDGIEFVHSEFIRDQMVKLNSDSEVELNITENDQYSNSNTLSLSFIRKKMILFCKFQKSIYLCTRLTAMKD